MPPASHAKVGCAEPAGTLQCAPRASSPCRDGRYVDRCRPEVAVRPRTMQLGCWAKLASGRSSSSRGRKRFLTVGVTQRRTDRRGGDRAVRGDRILAGHRTEGDHRQQQRKLQHPSSEGVRDFMAFPFGRALIVRTSPLCSGTRLSRVPRDPPTGYAAVRSPSVRCRSCHAAASGRCRGAAGREKKRRVPCGRGVKETGSQGRKPVREPVLSVRRGEGVVARRRLEFRASRARRGPNRPRCRDRRDAGRLHRPSSQLGVTWVPSSRLAPLRGNTRPWHVFPELSLR